jgi:hypothetical protein
MYDTALVRFVPSLARKPEGPTLTQATAAPVDAGYASRRVSATVAAMRVAAV